MIGFLNVHWLCFLLKWEGSVIGEIGFWETVGVLKVFGGHWGGEGFGEIWLGEEVGVAVRVCWGSSGGGWWGDSRLLHIKIKYRTFLFALIFEIRYKRTWVSHMSLWQSPKKIILAPKWPTIIEGTKFSLIQRKSLKKKRWRNEENWCNGRDKREEKVFWRDLWAVEGLSW